MARKRRKNLEWYGPEVVAKVRRAQTWAINAVMASCVEHAKQNHPWENRTVTLEGGIRVVNYATVTARGASGVWGVADVKYGIFLELGTSRMRPYPFLRPAADALYPQLAAKVVEGYRAGF